MLKIFVYLFIFTLNFPQLSPTQQTGLIVLLIWALAIKGVALWQAARSNQRNWFVALLVVNTFGILELVYLTWFKKKRVVNKD